MIKRYIVDEDLILKDYLKKIGIFFKYSKRNKKIEWPIFSKRSDG